MIMRVIKNKAEIKNVRSLLLSELESVTYLLESFFYMLYQFLEGNQIVEMILRYRFFNRGFFLLHGHIIFACGMMICRNFE